MKIVGGFASQFNKYVLGYALSKRLGTELRLDLSDYHYGYFRPYSLCYLTIPGHKLIIEKNIKKALPGVHEVKNSEDMRRMLAYPRGNYWINREEEDYQDFLDEEPGLEIGVSSEALRYLALRPDLKADFFSKFCREVDAEKAVAVHVRRGDFVNLGWEDQLEFYKAAIEWFCNRLKGVQFYFFSNDLTWVSQQFGKRASFHYVSSAQGNLGDVQELLCMAYCRYRILSRFSGYGFLANILSAYQRGKDREGFAVMNGGGVYTENGELLERQKAEYQNLTSGKILKPEKGGIYYLSSEEISFWEHQYQKNEMNQAGKCLPHGEGTESLWFSLTANIQKYKMLQEDAYLRECLESTACPVGNDYVEDWERIYGIQARLKWEIWIVTAERKNRWRIENCFLLALMLARLGNSVHYCNWGPDSEARNEPISPAGTIDGKIYPFLYHDLRTEIGIQSLPGEGQGLIVTDLLSASVLNGKGNGNIWCVTGAEGQLSKCGVVGAFKEKIFRFMRREQVLPVSPSICWTASDVKMPYDIFGFRETQWLQVIQRLTEIGEEYDQ